MNDELERDDLDAWDVEPLCADFETQVMAAWDAPTPLEETPRNRSIVWAAALSFAAAAALAVALWPRPEAGSEDAISIRASASAQIDYSPGSHRAEQTSGTVTYRVRSGTPFVVRTPAADITVHGTEFTVEMLSMQDERRRKYLGAGALAMGGAAVAIYVAAGQVEVHNEHGRTELAPGEMVVASEHAGPRSEPAPILAVMPVPKPVAKKRARRITATQREDVRRRIQKALGNEKSGDFSPNEEASAVSDDPPSGTLDKGYIREVVEEDLLPIAKECYESALEDDPDLGGRLMLQFSIVGDESVGGIVDEVSIDDDASTMKHPSLGECMTESTATLFFDPPEDGGRVVVRYPFVFQPTDG